MSDFYVIVNTEDITRDMLIESPTLKDCCTDNFDAIINQGFKLEEIVHFNIAKDQAIIKFNHPFPNSCSGYVKYTKEQIKETLTTPEWDIDAWEDSVSLALNGTDEYGYAENFNVLNNTAKFTIAGWIYNDWTDGTAEYLLNSSDAHDNTTNGIYILKHASGLLYFGIKNDGVGGSNTANLGSNGLGWHHIILGFDGANQQVNMAYNGSMVTMQQVVNPTSTYEFINNKLYLGKCGNYYANMYLGDWMFLDEYLTEAQCVELYNQGYCANPLSLSTYGNIKNAYRMGDAAYDTVSQIVDIIGENNLTLVNVDSANFKAEVPGG